MAAVAAEPASRSWSSRRASELGADPFEQIGEGTHFAQPALFIAGLAHWKAAGEPERGVLRRPLARRAPGPGRRRAPSTPSAGLRLAVVRGRLMEEASRGPPRRHGRLARRLRRGRPQGRRRIRAHRSPTTTRPARWSSPATPRRSAKRARRCAPKGAKAIRLPVAGAFHSPLMEPAVPGYRRSSTQTEFAAADGAVTPRSPPPPSTTSAPTCSRALTEPVRWRETLAAMQRRRRHRPSSRPAPATSSPASAAAPCGEELESRTLDVDQGRGGRCLSPTPLAAPDVRRRRR